jgi:O-antigen/teichoic acid export membrane protein
LGWGLPALLALASVPALTRVLGPDRFGLLAIAWAAVGAFALLDLGLGRATTLLVGRGTEDGRRKVDALPKGGLPSAAAEITTPSRLPSVSAVVAAGGAWMWLLFGPLALLGVLLAPWIVDSLLTVPPELRAEALGVLRMLAMVLPVAAHGVVLRGALEGQARWGLVNAQRAFLGVVTWGGPWLVATVTPDVRALVATIVCARVVYWLVQWAALGWAWRAPAMGALLRDGGWMTVSALATPALSLADRALIAAQLPIAGVGWYVATAETASKLAMVGAILQPLMFQGMVAARAAGQPLGPWLRRGSKWTLALLLPMALPVLWLAPELLPWWLAESFTPDAVLAFRLFVGAMIANALALVAYAALHATGRARTVALIHLAQLPLYLPVLLWAATQWGAVGVSVVWALRAVLDAAALWLALQRAAD